MSSLVVGSIFARDFRVVRPLGEGGMGSVFVVEQLSTGNLRALKLMHPQLVADPNHRRRFEQESRVGARIQSEHVVQVVAAGVDDATGTPFIAMEMLHGEDLAHALRRRGPFSAAETRDVIMQVSHALAAAHAAGIVHRDLKPENIFLAASQREGGAGVVKVLDFGIAKVVADAQTHATAAIGTPLWMSPEQTATGAQIGPPADIWPLALICFTMLTARVFWMSGNMQDATTTTLLREIIMDPIPAASARAAQLGVAVPLPPGFDAWFARCLVREPHMRFANAGEARAAFAQMMGGYTPVTSYAQPPNASQMYASPGPLPQTSAQPFGARGPTPPGATPAGFGVSAPGTSPAAAPAPPGAASSQVTKKGSSLPLVIGIGVVAIALLAVGGVVVAKKVSSSRSAKECDDSAANATATNAAALAESCRLACDAQPGAACVLRGDLVRRFRIGDKASEVAQASFQKGCDAGAQSGCRRVGNMIETKEPKRAAELYANACNAGDAAACTASAVMLELGLGVDRDGTKAASLYEKACKSNDALGCAYHAFMLEAGRGVKRDEKRVADLLASTLPGLEKACDKGEMRECVALGFASETGPKPDQARAAVLYQRACEEGFQSGCSNLAVLNFLGKGVFKDLTRAIGMFDKACEAGEPTACTNLGIIRSGTSFGLRHGVRGVTTFKLTCEAQFQVGCAGWGMLIKVPPELPPGPSAAVALSTKGCDGGDLVACVNLGAFYQAALGTAKNRQRASELFKKACDAGNAGGCGEYGTMYLLGRGVPLDGKRGQDLLTQACEWGELDACSVAADAYTMGFEGIPKNLEKAAATYKRYCDESKISGACNAYASALAQGLGVKKDAPAAIALFKEIATDTTKYDKPYVDAYSDLGAMYEQGVGVMRDYGEAASYYKNGCNAGSLRACAGYARLLADGLGVARDPDKARQLVERGCKVGEGNSCGALAVFYLFGKAGLTKDGERGLGLYKELCDDGDWGACGNVGAFMIRGLSVKLDREGGAAYLRKACAHNTEWACTEMKRNMISP